MAIHEYYIRYRLNGKMCAIYVTASSASEAREIAQGKIGAEAQIMFVTQRS